MGGRLPRVKDMLRIHTHIPSSWLKIIDKAAASKLMSRSNYMAQVIYKQAQRDANAAAK